MDRGSERSKHTRKGSGQHRHSNRAGSQAQKYNIPYLLNENPAERPDEIMVDVENEPDSSHRSTNPLSGPDRSSYAFFSARTKHSAEQKHRQETKHKVRARRYKCPNCGHEFSSCVSLQEQYVITERVSSKGCITIADDFFFFFLSFLLLLDSTLKLLKLGAATMNRLIYSASRHHKSKVFPCDECESVFTEKGNLK